MELTRSLVEEKAREYEEAEPLYTVEQEHVEMLPGALRSGQYGWRDVEWIVQWYFRRFLGDFPDAERRATEDRFRENDYETVRNAIDDAIGATDDAAALEPLTDLAGVDVPVGSAFLLFIDPGAYIVVGEREWSVLHDAGELTDPSPGTPSPADYERYLGTSRALGATFDCDMWTLYRALWRLWKEA